VKVFEVLTEHAEIDSKEIITTRQYVTSKANTLKSVVDHFTQYCFEYEKELKSVREVVVITEHIE